MRLGEPEFSLALIDLHRRCSLYDNPLPQLIVRAELADSHFVRNHPFLVEKTSPAGRSPLTTPGRCLRCKDSRKGIPASRKIPVRSPNGTISPDPGLYRGSRNSAACLVQARRAAEFNCDSFHVIAGVWLRAQIRIGTTPSSRAAAQREREGRSMIKLPPANAASAGQPVRNACYTIRTAAQRSGVPDEWTLQT